MFKVPDTRLSASNSAVLASESFLVPVTLHSEAKGSEAALDALRSAFEEVKGFAPALAGTAPGVVLVSFDEAISPRLSRVEVERHGKEHRVDLTFAFRCPLPKDQDFWGRVRLSRRCMMASHNSPPSSRTGRESSCSSKRRGWIRRRRTRM